GVFLASTLAQAQSLALAVMDTQGLSEGQLKRLQRAASEGLKALSALPFSETEWRGPRKSCAIDELPCQRDKVRAAGTPAGLALWLARSGDVAQAQAALWLDGERLAVPARVDVPLDAMDAGFK